MVKILCVIVGLGAVLALIGHKMTEDRRRELFELQRRRHRRAVDHDRTPL